MKTRIVLMVVVALMVAVCARAQEASPWHFEFTPYAWLAGLEGDVKINGYEAEFDKSFSDLFESLSFAFSGLGVAQYRQFLFWGQLDYFHISTSELDIEDQPEGGSVDMETVLGEYAFGVQLNGWMEGQTFDILLGARTLSLESELEVYGVGKVVKENSLTDPILVVRPSMLVWPSKTHGRLRFNPTLAIGGGGDADLVYEMHPSFQYQITPKVAARLGYRRIGYKFTIGDDDDNEFNFAMSGLIMGVGMRF